MLHGFGDARKKGCSTAIYADGKVTQGLLASKSRITKKDTSIPSLELVSAHMIANLLTNFRTALDGYAITGVHGWLDSTVALY